MTRRTIYIICVLLSPLILFGCKSEKQLRQAAAAEIGQVDLRPEMTLADLKKLLRDDNLQVLSSSFSNWTTLSFRHGLVQAVFITEYPKSFPTDGYLPKSIAAYALFMGTVAGMPIRTSYESALDNVRKFYPTRRSSTAVSVTRLISKERANTPGSYLAIPLTWTARKSAVSPSPPALRMCLYFRQIDFAVHSCFSRWNVREQIVGHERQEQEQG